MPRSTRRWMRAWTMSSETSTESRSPVVGDLKVSETSDALAPWQLFALAGLVGATIVVFISRGQSPAAIILLSLTIFSAAAVGAAALRACLPLARPSTAQSRSPVVGGRTRVALEREKSLVLRSIKELEFDRAMGKVSEKDFAEMSARLRARAAGLLRQLDAGTGYRELIEREIERRIGGSARRDAGSIEQDPAYEQKDVGPAQEHVGRVLPSRPAENECNSCGTHNDGDAKFCKQCGKDLARA